MRDVNHPMDRRNFLMSGLSAAAGAAIAGTGIAHANAPAKKDISLSGKIPTRKFGKTGHELPVLGCGGSAMVQMFIAMYGAKLISTDERVAMIRHAYDQGVRFFDTARVYGESEEIMGAALKDVRDNVFIASKVAVANPEQVRRSVETTLEKLGTSYVDLMQIHSPAIERVGFEGGMKIRAELGKLRDEGMIRFIGLTTHIAFEDVYKMIETGEFDQVLLAYSYFRRSMTGLLSVPKIEWRERCLAKAHELNMGIVAMKVMGANVMTHDAPKIAPDYDEATRERLAAAAIRWVLNDERVGVLNIGVTYPSDIDKNVKTVTGSLELTNADHALLSEFMVKAYESDIIKSMETA